MKKKTASNVKTIAIIVLLFVIAFLLYRYQKAPVEQEAPVPVKTTEDTKTAPAVSITTKKINEANFSGTEPVIIGTNTVAEASRVFIAQSVADFKVQADRDVPAMRAQFGADAPPATYTIDIEAKYKNGIKTDSMIISTYAYTGGANGNSSYKVITASHTSGKILSLSDAVKADKQAAFTEYVKKQLLAYKPEGSTAPVVFPDIVKDLTFSSFRNWSINDTNLMIYFDKYEIGPGVLGAVAFPLPISQIKDYLVATFI